MKRRVVIATLIILGAGYMLAYRFLPKRDAGRFRNADVFVHVRYFSHDWECRIFYPAGWVESLIIRAYPYPFLPHPSWSELPQVLLLEGPEYRNTFPRHAFRKG